MKAIVLGTVLFAPSVWMLSVIPPLWRDLDAYIQLTYPPGLPTIMHFGPAYCFGARIPLYIGYAIESLRASKPFPSPVFFIHPTLNDSGVFLLLFSQHVALLCSAFYFIVLTSRLFWVRLTLAALWASNPLFYTFANCVGSETLSMILLLLVGAVGLRIVQGSRYVGWKRWLLFGVLLWLSILTRHINLMLVAVMPLTFLFLSGYWLITVPLSRRQLPGGWRPLRAWRELKKAMVAVAIGAISITLANVSMRGLCRVARVPYYSTLGISVLNRLEFLARLPAEKRNQLFDEIARETSSGQVKKAMPLLHKIFSSAGTNLETDELQRKFSKKDADKVIPLAREAFPQGSTGLDHSLVLLRRLSSVFPGWSLYAAVNSIAKAFLIPPRSVYLRAVAEDFKRSQKTTIENVVSYLFLSTTFYFIYPSGMMAEADWAPLVTFRNGSPNRIVAILEKHWYFHLWKSLSHAAFLCFWAANLALLVPLAQMRKKDVGAVASYAVALTLVGLLMIGTSCLLVEFLPRFALPTWELTILSATILLGKTMECWFSRYIDGV